MLPTLCCVIQYVGYIYPGLNRKKTNAGSWGHAEDDIILGFTTLGRLWMHKLTDAAVGGEEVI